MSLDLQQRVQPFGLLLVNLGDRVRIGSPGRYIDFADRKAAEAAVSLLEMVSPERRAIEPLPFKEPSPELFRLLEETRKRHDT
jgi:hypothetical protein